MKTIKNHLYRFGSKAQLLGGLAITAFVNTLFLFTANIAGAQMTPSPGLNITDVNQINSKVLCPIFNSTFFILMSISIIMILWAAFTYMRAEDDADKVSRATKTITYAVVGIAVALLAKAAPLIIGSIFGVEGLTTCGSGFY